MLPEFHYLKNRYFGCFLGQCVTLGSLNGADIHSVCSYVCSCSSVIQARFVELKFVFMTFVSCHVIYWIKGQVMW